MTTDTRQKIFALYGAAKFKPQLGLSIVVLSFVTAFLEGVGLGFILPILEVAQQSSPSDATGPLSIFVRAFSFVGVPLSLEYLIVGVAIVMMVRFGLSFLIAWLRAMLSLSYQRQLRSQLFESLMYSPIDYIDRTGSDELLNSLITETSRAAGINMAVFNIIEIILRGMIYLCIAAILSPTLTLAAIVSLGTSNVFVRYILEPAYNVGDEVADVNSRIQTISQTGIQGMRDVRLFNMRGSLISSLYDVLDRYVDVSIRYSRNQAALNNLNQFLNALVVFTLVYVGFSFTPLSLAELGVFLFAIFRLSPVVNQINTSLYNLDGQLPHLIRINEKIEEMSEQTTRQTNGTRSIRSVDRLEFDDVSFAYGDDDPVLRDISFSVTRGQKVALVGPSGAGKSTIIALLSRLQSPDSGRIVADGTSIDMFNIDQWRERLAIVRQNPYLFDDTLWGNITVGNENASRTDVKRVCEIAQVTEFLPELPDGYDTQLGEDGVRLSGGQKQRVAIARALLRDADILVLDEATSELDSNIEESVYQGIQSLENEYLTISIAHRLSTVNDADQIYTLVDGSVVETGNHEQLLENDGPYASLYITQSTPRY